eukprot:c32528_g1_i1 orf=2-208(-)
MMMKLRHFASSPFPSSLLSSAGRSCFDSVQLGADLLLEAGFEQRPASWAACCIYSWFLHGDSYLLLASS